MSLLRRHFLPLLASTSAIAMNSAFRLGAIERGVPGHGRLVESA